MPHDRWTIWSVFAHLAGNRHRWLAIPGPLKSRPSHVDCIGRHAP
jgi:hypothetical protein